MSLLDNQQPNSRRRHRELGVDKRLIVTSLIVLLGLVGAVAIGYKLIYGRDGADSRLPVRLAVYVGDESSVFVECGNDNMRIRVWNGVAPQELPADAPSMKISHDGLFRLVDALGGALINVPEKIEYRGADSLPVRIDAGMRRLDVDRIQSYFKRPNSMPAASLRAVVLGLALRGAELSAANVDVVRLLEAALEPGAKGEDERNASRLAAVVVHAAKLGPSDISIEWKGPGVNVRPAVAGEPPAAAPASVPLPIKMRLLNGTGKAGLAARFSSKFPQPAFQIIETANADRFGYRATVVRSSREEIARAVIGALGFGRYESASPGAGSDCDVVLGADAR